jgi:DNA (cytosine-5)-methyltransferase 1
MSSLPKIVLKDKAISLFSGCGGDTHGLESAGFNVVAFNEFNPAAVVSHLANFPNSVLLQTAGGLTDIIKVPDSVFEVYKGEIDIVFAGFPCQGFSSAGKRNLSDPRNSLYKQFVRVVKCIQPPFFIGENVAGIESMLSGPAKIKDGWIEKPNKITGKMRWYNAENDDYSNERPYVTAPSMLEVITQTFSEIGYNLTYRVVEATEFGIQQKRKRILIVGYKKDIKLDSANFWSSVLARGSEFTSPKLRSYVQGSLHEAFEIPAGNVPKNFEKYALTVPQGMEVSGTPHPYVVLKASATDEEYGGKKFKTLLSCAKRDSPIHSEILDLDAPSKTIICTYDHQPRLLVGLRKPDGTAYCRVLYPDELKQIQGFPSSYKILGTKKEQVVQIGNAAPPALVLAVAENLRSHVNDELKKIEPVLATKKARKIKQ